MLCRCCCRLQRLDSFLYFHDIVVVSPLYMACLILLEETVHELTFSSSPVFQANSTAGMHTTSAL